MKKALIIGIDNYDTRFIDLKDCVNSSKTISTLLARNETIDNPKGEPNFDCKLLTSSAQKKAPKITRALIKENCKALFEDEEADVVFFYFSGYAKDDQSGGYLIAQDAREYDEGFALNELFIYANNSNIKEINIILNCHYSDDSSTEIPFQSQLTLLRKGINILSVKSSQHREKDLFAELICTSLNGSNADILGNITVMELYEQSADILTGLGYSIEFKSNISRLSVIRKTIPKISYEIVMKIRTYFNGPHYYYKLSKEHIPSLDLGNKKLQTEYKHLQKLFKQGLVKPVNAHHFYYAAFNEKHCVLTERGRQFWQLLEAEKNTNL